MSYRGADPTAVMGRRVAAHLIDVVLMAIAVLAILYPIFLSVSRTVPAGSFSCVDDTPLVADGSEPPAYCFQFGDEIRYVPHHEAGSFQLKAFVTLWGVTITSLVLVQGFLGGSPGKLILGLRVIRPDGTDAGPLRCALRTLLLPVDLFCCGVVGLLTADKTRGHRRVGDLAAGTMVIGRDDQLALILARSGVALPDRTSLAAQAWTERQPPASAPAPSIDDQIVIPGSWPAPAPGTDYSAGPTGWEPPPIPSTPAPPAASSAPAPAAAPGVEGPVWDERRGTYVQFDPDLAMWVQWDAAAGQWIGLQP